MRAGVPISRFADAFGGGMITFDNPYCTYPRYLGHWLTWGHGHQAHTVCVDFNEADAILVVRRNVIGAGVVTKPRPTPRCGYRSSQARTLPC